MEVVTVRSIASVVAKRVKQASRVADARKIRLGEDGFCELGDKAAHPCLPHLPVFQVNSRSIDQKSGEIWTAQADLQPISFKSDRLLAHQRNRIVSAK